MQRFQDFQELDNLISTGKVDDVIRYVTRSNDFFSYAKHAFKFVFESSPKDAVKLFFNPTVKSGSIFEVVSFFDTVDNIPGSQRAQMKTEYLEFCVWVQKITDTEVHHQLISSYLAIIQSCFEKEAVRSTYVMIKDEKEPMKTYRVCLLNILKRSTYYHPSSFTHRINPMLIEERLIAFSRAGNYETCVEILVEDVPEVVITEFCDSVVNEHPSIYNELIEKMAHNFPAKYELFKSIMNKKSIHIDPEIGMKLIPAGTKLQDYTAFFDTATTKRIQVYNKSKLELALLYSNLQTNISKFDERRTSKKVLYSAPICAACFKPVDTDFILKDDGSIIHVNCQ